MTRQLKIVDLLYFKGKINNDNIKLDEIENKNYYSDYIVFVSVIK